MDRIALYHASNAVFGVCVVANGIASLRSSGFSISSSLMTVAGLGYLAVTGYYALTGTEPNFDAERYVWVYVVAAGLALFGTVLLVLS